MPNYPTFGTWFQSPSNTPTGDPMEIAVDNPYMTKEQFILQPEAQGLGINASSTLYTSGALDTLILQASTTVNRYCNRHFDHQRKDEQKPNVSIQVMNPRLLHVPLKEGPLNQVNTIYIQVLQWFIRFELSYLQQYPEPHYYKIVPMLTTTMGATPIPSPLLEQSDLGVVWTNYDFGYSREVTDAPGTVVTQYTVYKFTETGNPTGLNTPLWVRCKDVVVKKNGVTVPTTDYTVNYRDGLVTFNSTLLVGDVVTASFWTYDQAIPVDIMQATTLVLGRLIGNYMNPFGLTMFKTQNTTYQWGDGKSNAIDEQVKRILEPYRFNPLAIS